MARKQSFLVSVLNYDRTVFFLLSCSLYIQYMDKIDKDSSFSSGVTFGECNVWRQLFADDFALLSSNKSDLQYVLNRFFGACLDTG